MTIAAPRAQNRSASARASVWRAAEAAFAAACTKAGATAQKTVQRTVEKIEAAASSPAPRTPGKRPILGLAKTCLN